MNIEFTEIKTQVTEPADKPIDVNIIIQVVGTGGGTRNPSAILAPVPGVVIEGGKLGGKCQGG